MYSYEIISIIGGKKWTFLLTQLVKNPPAMQELPVWFLRQEGPLEKG